MYEPNQPLERELRFTRAYQEHRDDHKARREYYVLEQQIPCYFVRPCGQDLLAGRINRPFLTFSPCIEGDGIDKVGYGIDEQTCRSMLAQMEQDNAYTKEYTDQVRDMIEFWHEENTNSKIRKRIPKEYLAAMPSDDYVNVPVAIHPIYRVAGFHLDFDKLYAYGLSGLISLISCKEEETDDEDKKILYSSMVGVLELMRTVIGQYIEEVTHVMDEAATSERREHTHMMDEAVTPERREQLGKMRSRLEGILDDAPQTFGEALQLQTIYMLAGRHVEIGRLDDYMGEIYAKSLREGTVTHDEAVALLDNFFSIIEQEAGRDTRAIIGGLGRKDPKVADEFAMLVLDVLEIRQDRFYPQVSLRYYKGISEALYDRTLALISGGCTFPILFNDDVNIASVMRAMDVPRVIAEQYGFFGCGEYMLAKKSCGTPNTALNIALVLELAMNDGHDPVTGGQWGPKTGLFTNETTFGELCLRFKEQLDFFCDMSGTFEELLYDVCNEEGSFLQVSMLTDDCIERGRGVFDGGIYHLGGTVETYGNVTAYDSLSAIREIVYDKKLITPESLNKILAVDYEGYPVERLMMKNAAKFGNDDAHADRIAVEFHEYICNAIRRQRERTRLDSFLVVVINNSMNVTLGRFVGATADGRKSGSFLSNGNSAYDGSDKNGLTALLNSMAKMDTSIHAGANQNVKLSRELFTRNSFKDIKSIIGTYFDKGGQQLSLSIVSQADLEDALVHPENHKNLIVRVGGFSARFSHLDPAVQQDMLSRTAY